MERRRKNIFFYDLRPLRCAGWPRTTSGGRWPSGWDSRPTGASTRSASATTATSTASRIFTGTHIYILPRNSKFLPYDPSVCRKRRLLFVIRSSQVVSWNKMSLFTPLINFYSFLFWSKINTDIHRKGTAPTGRKGTAPKGRNGPEPQSLGMNEVCCAQDAGVHAGEPPPGQPHQDPPRLRPTPRARRQGQEQGKELTRKAILKYFISPPHMPSFS